MIATFRTPNVAKKRRRDNEVCGKLGEMCIFVQAMDSLRLIDGPEQMAAVIRHFGIIPFFKGAVPGWSVEELTAPGCWFTEDEDGGTLGPWDWKIECVREGDIAYGKFLGGKAAFATVEYYRHLMNWRRSLPKYRMALGERYKTATNSDRLMKVLSPIALDAIKANGSLEAREIREVCSKAITPAQIKSMGASFRNLLTPALKKNTIDSLIQFLQMGTWTVTGDFRRVYRGPDLSYSGWQRASNTTPDELFASGNDIASEAPFWAKMFENESSSMSLETDCTPQESRDFLIEHVLEFFPETERKKLERLF